MGHEKKRSSLTDIALMSPVSAGHISSFSTASALSRQPLPGRGGYAALVTRSPSPPASAYFSDLPLSEEPTAFKDATAHFAYSTTLRRHTSDSILPTSHSYPSGASSSKLQSLAESMSSEGVDLWRRVISTVGGQSLDTGQGNEHASGQGHGKKSLQETPSSVYAHSSIEVRLWSPHDLHPYSITAQEIVQKFRSSVTGGLPMTSIPSL